MATGTVVTVKQAAEAEAAIRNSVESLLSIVEQHQLDTDGDVSKSLRALNNRIASKSVRLVVLGEFSAGKTTFINSLLGTDILRTGILPTTAVCTYISYGCFPRCEVLLKTGKTLQLSSQEIGAFSVEGSSSSELEEVRLQLPSSVLADGLIIVDTPGVNVNIEAHEAITSKAIEEANACVYLMDARQPGKKTTIDFLRKLAYRVGKFFFVLNRADILEADEQQEALDFVQQALKNECGIEKARVALLSSTLASGDEFWESRFHEFNSELQSFMQNERQLVIATETARLASAVNARAEHLLKNKWSLAEQELAAHHKVRLPASDELVRHLRNEITGRVEIDAAAVRGPFKEFHQQLTGGLRRSIIEAVNSARSKEDLTDSVQDTIGSSFRSATQSLQEYLLRHLRRTFEDTSSKMTNGVAYLLRGVTALEDRAFFSRRFPYVLSGIGGLIGLTIAVALFSGSSEVWRSPSFPLFVASGCIFGLIAARLLWTRRTSFSAPRFDSLDPSTFASQASSGFLFGCEKSRETMIRGGRQLGMAGIRTGHPLFAGIGLAISAVGALFAPSFEKLKRETMSNSLNACDQFTAATATEGAAFLERGYERVLQNLLLTIENTVARYDRIIERLVTSQRPVTEALERRRTELRAAVEHSNRVQQQLAIDADLIRNSLLGYDIAFPTAPARASDDGEQSGSARSSGPVPFEIPTTVEFDRGGSSAVVWLFAAATSIAMLMVGFLLLPHAAAKPPAADPAVQTLQQRAVPPPVRPESTCAIKDRDWELSNVMMSLFGNYDDTTLTSKQGDAEVSCAFDYSFNEGGFEKRYIVTVARIPGQDCHACEPALTSVFLYHHDPVLGWKLESEGRDLLSDGDFGNAPAASSMQIGPDLTALKLVWGHMAQGNGDSRVLIAAPIGPRIVPVWTARMSQQNCTGDRCSATEWAISTVPGANPTYYDISYTELGGSFTPVIFSMPLVGDKYVVQQASAAPGAPGAAPSLPNGEPGTGQPTSVEENNRTVVTSGMATNFEENELRLAGRKQVIDSNPERSRQLNAQGLQLLSSSPPDIASAKRAFEGAIELDKTNVEALNNLAFVYIRSGDLMSAETALLKVLSISPKRRVAHGNLGYVQAKLGKAAAATEQFCEYVRLADSWDQGIASLSHFRADADPNVQLVINATLASCTH
jgi:ribosome biogenesis GTPase A